MSYSKSHVILIAFAIDTPDSLDNVTVKVRFGSFCVVRPSALDCFGLGWWVRRVLFALRARAFAVWFTVHSSLVPFRFVFAARARC